jgi:hypothetical protein
VHRGLLHDIAVGDTSIIPPDATMVLRNIVSPAELAPLLQADDAAYAAMVERGAAMRAPALAHAAAILDETAAVWGPQLCGDAVLTVDNAAPLLVNGILCVALQRPQFAECKYLFSIAGRDRLDIFRRDGVYVSARCMHGGTRSDQALLNFKERLRAGFGQEVADGISCGGHKLAAGGTFPGDILATLRDEAVHVE